MAGVKTGRWELWEKRAFLEGLRRYGRGKWKKISRLIPTRTPIQVKTHAQVMLKKLASGAKVIEYLDSGDDATEMSVTIDEDAKQFVSSFVPSTILHMTPNKRDVDAANILADLHLLCA